MKTTALLLAGKRDGALDPLAASHGVTHKCLVSVAGVPMLTHALEALAASPSIGSIVVSIDDSEVLAGIPIVDQLSLAGRLQIATAQLNLVDSVIRAVKAGGFPLLITTADNVLLSPSSIDAIDNDARQHNTDVAVAFARRASVLLAHPDGQRRYYRFRDDAYSNCNLYWLGNSTALEAAEVFRSGGQFAKHPMRIIEAFGVLNLVRFMFGLGSLDRLFDRVSRRFRLSIRPVILVDGATAIDVDNERTHAIAEQLLMQRLRPEHGAAGVETTRRGTHSR